MNSDIIYYKLFFLMKCLKLKCKCIFFLNFVNDLQFIHILHVLLYVLYIHIFILT